MIPEFGGNLRRSSQSAADFLLDEQADVDAAEAADADATDAARPDRAPADAAPSDAAPSAEQAPSPDAVPSGAPAPSGQAVPNLDPGPWSDPAPWPGAGRPSDAATPPGPFGDPMAPPPPAALPADFLAATDPAPPIAMWPDGPGTPPPPPTDDEPRARRSDGHGRLSALAPILLAALGLAAAVIAWRVGVASNVADDANRAGIEAQRQRSAAEVRNEGLTSRATEAFLDYERSRRRAAALASAGANDDSLLNRMEAVAHWTLVQSQYFDRNGQFQPDQQRAALLASAEQSTDIQPFDHFQTADAEYQRIDGLILAGIILALALPFLTLAEIGRGRLRAISLLGGSGIFAVALALAARVWL